MSAATTQLALEREAPPLHQDAHGVIRVGQTRVTFEAVMSFFDQGATGEEIALLRPLDLHDVYATLGYYLGHRQQVQTYLDRQRQRSLAARRKAESRSPTVHIRERLHRQRTRGLLRLLADWNPTGTSRAGSLGAPCPKFAYRAVRE